MTARDLFGNERKTPVDVPGELFIPQWLIDKKEMTR